MTSSRGGLWARIRALPKMPRFAVFLALAALAAAAGSVLTWVTVYREPALPPVAVALVAPMTGPEAAIGAALRDGAALGVAEHNAQRGRRPIRLAIYDAAMAGALERAARDPDVVAIVSPDGGGAAEETLVADHRVSRVSLAGAPVAATAWSQPLSADRAYEARFLANYVRNVVGEKLVSIILPDTPEWSAVAGAFDETLQRFGTRVVYRWSAPADPAARQAALDAAAHEISDKQLAGAVLVLGEPSFAARAVAALGAAKVINRVIGLRDLGTAAFRADLAEVWRGEATVAQALNQTLFTSPVLFDTAGASAQAFADAFKAAHSQSPDWVATLGFDALSAVGTALDAVAVTPGATGRDLRAGLHDELARHASADSALAGLAGPIFFGARGGSALPTQIGVYNGQTVVAAETQLSPIRDEGVTNYLDQLTGGKALYVNDRFMYRTNVVAAGVRLNKISDPKLDSNTVDLDFNLWFRWRGPSNATDIVFENAVQPIALGTPERATDDGDLHYRTWRVRGKFFLNVSALTHPFGTQMVSVAFRHRTLARNNLVYVADVVGMDLAAAAGHGPTAPTDWLSWLFGAARDGESALAQQLRDGRALAGAPGWVIDRALFAQNLDRAGTDGDPSYVGFGKPAPVFSHMEYDVQIKPDTIDLRGQLPQSLIVYLAIFALSGAALAHLLDRRDRGQIWRMQTLILRLITWPVLLATGSALALDYMVANASLPAVETVAFLTSALWWLVPARLLALTVERFVWAPLEARSGRRVPTVFRMIVELILYLLAGFGIVSFVLDRPITSLLATSGLITLIFGLAVQSNLKDIFSGIMLNLERPFVLNDWIRINRIEAQVTDISWRTTRLRTRRGQVFALANGRVVEAEIENLTRAGHYDADATLFMDPRCSPDAVLAAINRAIASVTGVIPFKLNKAELNRIENINGTWVARYIIETYVDDIGQRSKLSARLWPALWRELGAADLLWALTPHQSTHEADALARDEAILPRP